MLIGEEEYLLSLIKIYPHVLERAVRNTENFLLGNISVVDGKLKVKQGKSGPEKRIDLSNEVKSFRVL
ncbi:MAG: hypothetical protein LBF15_02485, partial [Candidatus Peribacteria bacterium]|nr:hypothetical protein [Candidatus Peribacteria bacterium]